MTHHDESQNLTADTNIDPQLRLSALAQTLELESNLATAIVTQDFPVSTQSIGNIESTSHLQSTSSQSTSSNGGKRTTQIAYTHL